MRLVVKPLLVCFIAAFTGALLLPAAARAQFVISSAGTNPNTMAGQNFSPSVEPTPNPGLNAGDTVFLTSFSFVKGSDTATGNPNTVLVIMDGAYPDVNGNPDGSYIPTTANVRGVSSNVVDTNAVVNTPLAWNFSSLPLTYGNNYMAAFATVGAGGVLSFINVNAMYVNYQDIGGGVFRPVTNYGGGPTVANPSASGNFNANALYGPPSASGFFAGDGFAADAAFTATFLVPEPASIASIGLVGLVALARRRRAA